MDELEKFVAEVEGQLEAFDEKIAYARRVYTALAKAQFLVDDDSDELFWVLCHWPVDLNQELDDVRSRLTKYRNRSESGIRLSSPGSVWADTSAYPVLMTYRVIPGSILRGFWCYL